MNQPDDRSAMMNTYREPPVTFVRGSGSYLWDSEGRKYLDFLSGLAVTSLGHSHPAVTRATADQAATLVHVSNLFGNALAPQLASKIDALIGGPAGQVFFTNSGAEANECALKLARKWAQGDRHVVVCTWDAFHGRTLATLTATGQPAKHAPFEPLPTGFEHVPYDDLDALEKACEAAQVAGVLVEPILGESGVIAPSSDYVAGVREICSERNILMMVDEIQTGLCRTGRWFCFQHSGVEPDVVTMAKALGNGFPIGACWARAEVAAAFGVGDHGSTFGGQPLAAAAALATIRTLEEEDAADRARSAGSRLRSGVEALAGVTGVRGMGLLLGVALEEPKAEAVVAEALSLGLVVNAPRPDTVRLAPSLLVSSEEIDEATVILGTAIERAA